jgi:hypothetical protein
MLPRRRQQQARRHGQVQAQAIHNLRVHQCHAACLSQVMPERVPQAPSHDCFNLGHNNIWLPRVQGCTLAILLTHNCEFAYHGAMLKAKLSTELKSYHDETQATSRSQPELQLETPQVRADHGANSRNALEMTPNCAVGGRNGFYMFLLVVSGPCVMQPGRVVANTFRLTMRHQVTPVHAYTTAYGYFS